ncbi:MAG: hypothetical protein AAGF10_07470, partial [Verrucomicrobiota bacterium]
QELGARPGDSGSLTDITSGRRLGLIYDFNVTDAREHARYKMGQDPDVLEAFPAQEFKRVASRERPRGNWPERWQAAGGKLYNGRMIALKNDPVWTKLSRFGKPWPPFDFGSGMGVRDIRRREAEELGLIQPDDTPKPIDEDINKVMEDSVAGLDQRNQDRLKNAFGDQLTIDRGTGTARWQGDEIGRLFDRALADPDTREQLSLGAASWQATTLTPEAFALMGYQLILDSDHIRHIWKRHGKGNEKDKSQIGLEKLDFQVLPHVWRYPDAIKPGKTEDTLIFEKRVFGKLYLTETKRSTKNQTLTLNTAYKKP